MRHLYRDTSLLIPSSYQTAAWLFNQSMTARCRSSSSVNRLPPGIYTLLNTPNDWYGTVKHLRGLYEQTFFTFRTQTFFTFRTSYVSSRQHVSATRSHHQASNIRTDHYLVFGVRLGSHLFTLLEYWCIQCCYRVTAEDSLSSSPEIVGMSRRMLFVRCYRVCELFCTFNLLKLPHTNTSLGVKSGERGDHVPLLTTQSCKLSHSIFWHELIFICRQ
jgi:hypothetical protein